MSLPVNSKRDRFRAVLMTLSLNALNLITMFGIGDLSTEQFAAVAAFTDSAVVAYFYLTN